jgi:rhomboid protease GluP
MTGFVPIDIYGQWWSVLSAMYLHGGVLHIAFNMMALRNIGPIVAGEFGTNRFIIIYTVTGIVGFVVSYFAGVPFTIGASGAIFGLVGAAIYYGKSRGGQYGTDIFRQLATWTVVLFIFGFLVPVINNWAHGGGLISGILLGYLLKYSERKRETLTHKVLALICVVVTVLVLVWAVGIATYTRFAAPRPF